MTLRGYRLGCPMWAEPSWRGRVWSRTAPVNEALAHYSRVFNAVEGNTTFYSLPAASSVQRWVDQTPPTFRFCFKLPREVTHEKSLVGTQRAMQGFLASLAPLADRSGPLMIQLPASFGPDRLTDLDRFLGSMDPRWAAAVELRHRRFFEEPNLREQVEQMLRRHGRERIVIDTRALRAGDPHHPGVLAARHQKPDLPVFVEPLTDTPVYRWVGHPDAATNEPWLVELAGWVVERIREGRRPFVMIHCPDTSLTPWMARRLHERVSQRAATFSIDVGQLPAFAAESREEDRRQLDLF